MIHQKRHAGTAPHGILLAVVVVALIVVPSYLGEQGAAIIEAFSALLSQLGLLLLPIILLVIIIQFLSSSSGSFVSSLSSTRDPYTTRSISGSPSPVGVALFLGLVLFLLYNKVSIFGGGGNEGEE